MITHSLRKLFSNQGNNLFLNIKGVRNYKSSKYQGVILAGVLAGSIAFCQNQEDFKDSFEGLRPSKDKFRRIDALLSSEAHKEFVVNHLVHDTLTGEGLIEQHELYYDGEELVGLIKLGNAVNGHPGTVHGGVIATIFDNCFGWIFFARKENPGFTANLTVDFRSRLMANETVEIRVKVQEISGRKKYVSGTLTEPGTNKIYAEAKGLFIVPNAKVSDDIKQINVAAINSK